MNGKEKVRPSKAKNKKESNIKRQLPVQAGRGGGCEKDYMDNFKAVKVLKGGNREEVMMVGRISLENKREEFLI